VTPAKNRPAGAFREERSKLRVLLIEDDRMIGESLTRALRSKGMSLDWARTGSDGEEALANGRYSMVLLDLGLPKRPGLEILKSRRRQGDEVPVIVITARDELDDRVAGLDLGADDYLVKPFDVSELLARMRAVLRRRSGVAKSMLESGEAALDLATHKLFYRDQSLLLPAREFALMLALMERPGAILSRSNLEERLYGWGEEVESNAIDVLIHSIRKKFDKEIILNVRGAGWMVAKAGR
jgi:DNA-binding response OmpR family regulator